MTITRQGVTVLCVLASLARAQPSTDGPISTTVPVQIQPIITIRPTPPVTGGVPLSTSARSEMQTVSPTSPLVPISVAATSGLPSVVTPQQPASSAPPSVYIVKTDGFNSQVQPSTTGIPAVGSFNCTFGESDEAVTTCGITYHDEQLVTVKTGPVSATGPSANYLLIDTSHHGQTFHVILPALQQGNIIRCLDLWYNMTGQNSQLTVMGLDSSGQLNTLETTKQVVTTWTEMKLPITASQISIAINGRIALDNIYITIGLCSGQPLPGTSTSTPSPTTTVVTGTKYPPTPPPPEPTNAISAMAKPNTTPFTSMCSRIQVVLGGLGWCSVMVFFTTFLNSL